MLEQTDATMRF